MRVQNYWFWQGWVIIKNSALVDLVSRTIFVPKLAAILDFEPLGDQETIFNQLYHISTLKNICLEMKFVDLW